MAGIVEGYLYSGVVWVEGVYIEGVIFTSHVVYVPLCILLQTNTRLLEHRALLLFHANSESVTQNQRGFRRYFNVPPRGSIPGRNKILRWIKNVDRTGLFFKKKPLQDKFQSFYNKCFKIKIVTLGIV